MAPTTKGFYSVVQFCPDLDRGECANIGIVLVVPSLGYVGVRMSEDNEGPKQRFGADVYDDARLSLAKRALEGRIREEARSWTGPEDLLSFASKEGNNVVLALPRAILSEDAEAELLELHQRLVHVAPLQRRRVRKPDLKNLFESKLFGVPLRQNLRVPVPQLGELEIPYAYKNGRLNLVRPEAFAVEESAAISKATELAVKGHILYKHPDDSGEERTLIVVGGFDPTVSEDVKRRLAYILGESDTRLVRDDALDEFVEEVRRTAHN